MGRSRRSARHAPRRHYRRRSVSTSARIRERKKLLALRYLTRKRPLIALPQQPPRRRLRKLAPVIAEAVSSGRAGQKPGQERSKIAQRRQLDPRRPLSTNPRAVPGARMRAVGRPVGLVGKERKPVPLVAPELVPGVPRAKPCVVRKAERRASILASGYGGRNGATNYSTWSRCDA